MLSTTPPEPEDNPAEPLAEQMKTLDGAVKALTAGDKLANTGPLAIGTLVICVQRSGALLYSVCRDHRSMRSIARYFGEYLGYAWRVPVIEQKWFGPRAILWPTKHELVASIVARGPVVRGD